MLNWILDCLGVLAWPFSSEAKDGAKTKCGVKSWRLDKFEGEAPQDGEYKTPIEYITGGDGLPTRRFVRGENGYDEVKLES